ncbi:MAG: magnesium transporter [Gemmatimonadales bacterium]|nr:magnesium transporter [Gemmatimonadales bacterium]
MTNSNANPAGPERYDERVLDPSNLEAERHLVMLRFGELLLSDDKEAIKDLATELSPGDLSEILRPLSVGDTTRILRLLPPDPLAEVLSEIDNRSLSTLFTLLDNEEIADIIEEMPSDEATDLIGELDPDQAEEILAAMEPEEREEVTELLQHSPESAGGLMGKEFATCAETGTCGETVALLRTMDEDDLEETHFVYMVDARERLVGQIPLFRLLIADPEAPIRDFMEVDPLYVEVDLDQEEVANFFQTHDLISVPVVDHQMRLVGRITADDIMDVIEDEATEDISRLAGVSVHEFGEQSAFRVARSRLPWLLGALLGQLGAVLVMGHFEKSLEAKLTLAFYIPMIMAMAGNIGIQNSSVVVRGLATGEVDFYHLGRHLLRELGTALVTGLVVAISIFAVSFIFSGDLQLSQVLSLTLLLVVIFAAMAGSGIPLLLHRMGIDPAVATGPFITTANDVASMLIYLGLATLLLSLGQASAS